MNLKASFQNRNGHHVLFCENRKTCGKLVKQETGDVNVQTRGLIVLGVILFIFRPRKLRCALNESETYRKFYCRVIVVLKGEKTSRLTIVLSSRKT